MSSGANNAHPMTRRQMRELEKAASQPFNESRTEISLQNSSDAPWAQMGAMPSNIDTVKLHVSSTRRANRPTAKKRVPTKDHLSRAALLSALGVVTIALPMTGFADASMASPASASSISYQVSAMELAEGAAADHLLQGTVSSANGLREDPMARVVAADLASRSQARTAATCEPVAGATGFAETYVERVSVPTRPMAAGTYDDTSRFGWRWGTVHTGTDMAAPVGTPLYAASDGVIVHAGGGIEGRSGTLVIIEAEVDGVKTWFWYGHMYSSQVYVQEGDTVTAGQVIAGVGSNGYSTGPHLHFEIHVGEWDNAVNPLTWLSDHDAVYPGQC